MLPVWSNYSRGASIILEYASEAVAALNRVAALFGFIAGIWKEQFVALPLVISFTLIMGAEFGQSPRKRSSPNSPTSLRRHRGRAPTVPWALALFQLFRTLATLRTDIALFDDGFRISSLEPGSPI
jgi:hypothetical protein